VPFQRAAGAFRFCAGEPQGEADAKQANGQALNAGDAALLQAEPRLTLDQARDAEVLVFDLAP